MANGLFLRRPAWSPLLEAPEGAPNAPGVRHFLKDTYGISYDPYVLSIFHLKMGIAELLHLIAVIALLFTYRHLINTVQFSKPKDFFTNIKDHKKIIEKYEKDESKFFNAPSFFYGLNPDKKQQEAEIYTNVIGFLLGITMSSWIKVQFLDQIPSDSGIALTVNIGFLCLFVYLLFFIYNASLKQQGDPTTPEGKYAYAFYPLLGGLVLVGEALLTRIGDGLANITADRGWNDFRGAAIERNRVNNLVKAIKEIFPRLEENKTNQIGNPFDRNNLAGSILSKFALAEQPGVVRNGGGSSSSDLMSTDFI